MLNQEAIDDLKKDCSLAEIQRIIYSLEKFEETWISYSLDEAFEMVNNKVFSKYKVNA